MIVPDGVRGDKLDARRNRFFIYAVIELVLQGPQALPLTSAQVIQNDRTPRIKKKMREAGRG